MVGLSFVQFSKGITEGYSFIKNILYPYIVVPSRRHDYGSK